ncbi:MAG: tRNA (N(6)-L-threonylcarbamoyladenosine(37)-C(2))-methylthiotransferase MtaB, partial [Deltaproteobacteria bacterium]|nr:tRNA (N(6)-L-threonylcarbamoyladenosine(37)-C(2))-methylthiotransferase MtaB [Deltaproteobacteria bacterium]
MSGLPENASSLKKVSIATLGCKSNQYDSFAIEETLKGRGLEVVPFPSRADAYVINTCTVTARTDAQSRRLVRSVQRINPDALVIVTGCFAQVSPDEVTRMEGVDYILGNPQKERVADYVEKGRKMDRPETVANGSMDGTPLTLRARSSSKRTRATLKVQEGCSKACTYCIIPRARGASKSLPLPEVSREIDLLIENGFKEIVLTGIHLGAYGGDASGRAALADILNLIEEKETASACRFRLSSLDPDEVTEELIEIMKGARKICSHIHLPLQSGDNSIIKRMGRPYTREVFADTVLRLEAEVEDIFIGADVIAGFPGEGEKEFENTYSLLKDLPVGYLHIFPFSRRPGTPAAGFAGQVDTRTIIGRSERLRGLDEEKRTAFYRSSIGKTAEVLTESFDDKGSVMRKGKARNYVPVSFKAGPVLKNTFVNVRL